MADECHVNLKRGTEEISALLRYSKDPDDLCRVDLITSAGQFTATDFDYFESLLALRRQLEPHGLLIAVYGASINVWPSPMSRDMGLGLKAYKMFIGQQARMADLVDIFETGPDVSPSTVAEQERYKDAWLESLRAET